MDTLRWTLLLLGVLVLGGIWLWGRWRRRHGDDLDDLLDDTDWMEQVARRTRKQRGDPEPDTEELQDAFEAALHRDAPQEPGRGRRQSGETDDAAVARESDAEPEEEPATDIPDPARIRTEPPASRDVVAERQGAEDAFAHRPGASGDAPGEDAVAGHAEADREPAGFEVPRTTHPPGTEAEAAPEEPASRRPEKAEGVVRPPGEEDLILALFVMAPEGSVFPGDALGELLRDAGLQFGDMDIYHWFQQMEAGPPEAVFSVASMVEPGTLERTGDPDFHTPGLALFLRLPGPAPGGEAFEAMLATGRRLADGLGGELKDERRSTLTQQTIGHIRDRVREHALRQHTGRG
ncbi:MAG: cell division protein ZipA [Pseudomonadota bacterium]